MTVAFGKPTQVLGNGLHVKAPWASVEKLDGAVQNDVYNNGEAVDARLGNNSKATADASIQWQLSTKDTMDVFLDYRTFDNIKDNLVDRNFRASMNEVMAEYNPLESIEATQGGADLEELSHKVLEKMKAKVDGQINVKSVTIPIINFDESTQKRIDELQQETARTRIAEQKKDTSKAESEANKILEKSLNEETLISKCLDIVAEERTVPNWLLPWQRWNSPHQECGQVTDKAHKVREGQLSYFSCPSLLCRQSNGFAERSGGEVRWVEVRSFDLGSQNKSTSFSLFLKLSGDNALNGLVFFEDARVFLSLLLQRTLSSPLGQYGQVYRSHSGYGHRPAPSSHQPTFSGESGRLAHHWDKGAVDFDFSGAGIHREFPPCPFDGSQLITYLK